MTRYPFIPIRNVFVLPSLTVSLFVGRTKSQESLHQAESNEGKVVLIQQRDGKSSEISSSDDLFSFGVLVKITQIIKLPDDTNKVLCQGLERIKLSNLDMQTYSLDGVVVSDVLEGQIDKLLLSVHHLFQEHSVLHLKVPSQVVDNVVNNNDAAIVADMVSSYLELSINEKQQLIEIPSVKVRLELLLGWLNREKGRKEVEKSLDKSVQTQIEKIQKERFLREKMSAIQRELGEENSEVKQYRARLSGLPQVVVDKVEQELKRLSYFSYTSAEYGVIKDYLNWVFTLPWGSSSEDSIDLVKIANHLNREHYGLKEVKDRVIEFLARYKRTGRIGGSILLLYGPPGVGKTSVAHSIASAIGREFVAISLGGVTDESELRGHRRTYVGAVPGRIAQAVINSGRNNPVILLDEVDKIGVSLKGSSGVTSALLEVLDPEQNKRFFDRYLELPFDLSKTIFILTANDVSEIPAALKNRVEILPLPGYTEEEKVVIAKKYLIPQVLKDNGFLSEELSFTGEVIKRIIRDYTREAGVRELGRVFDRICRRQIRLLLEEKKSYAKISNHNLQHYLDPTSQKGQQQLGEVGIAFGNRWSEEGNSLLRIESSIIKGKGELVVSSNFSEEIIKIAKTIIGYIRLNGDSLGIASDVFQTSDLYLNLDTYIRERDLATIGLPLAISIFSAVTKRKTKDGIISIGDISLGGDLNSVEGIEECILSAAFNNPDQIIISRNDKYYASVISNKLKQTKVVTCENLNEVIALIS